MRTISALVLCLILSVSAIAHHSDAGLDMDSTVTFEGTIKEFHFRNPHMYFIVEADNPNGEPVEWSIQSGSAIGAARRGWTRDTLVPGERVLVSAHPARNGNPYGILESLDKEGGLGVGPGPGEVEVTASTTSLEGRWLAKFSEVPSFPGGIDGFFSLQLKLTEKGAAARDAYDPLSSENPESQCIGRPSPGMLGLEHALSDRNSIQRQRRDDHDPQPILGRGPHRPYGRSRAPGWWRARTFRPLDRALGRRHARRGYARLCRSSLAVSDRCTVGRAKTRRRALHTQRSWHAHRRGIHARGSGVSRRAFDTRPGAHLRPRHRYDAVRVRYGGDEPLPQN